MLYAGIPRTIKNETALEVIDAQYGLGCDWKVGSPRHSEP